MFPDCTLRKGKSERLRRIYHQIEQNHTREALYVHEFSPMIAVAEPRTIIATHLQTHRTPDTLQFDSTSTPKTQLPIPAPRGQYCSANEHPKMAVRCSRSSQDSQVTSQLPMLSRFSRTRLETASPRVAENKPRGAKCHLLDSQLLPAHRIIRSTILLTPNPVLRIPWRMPQPRPQRSGALHAR